MASVASESRELKRLAPEQLIARLDELAATTPNGLLAFDADGTLWSGDVGEDVFHEAVKTRLIGEPARAALEQAAREQGVPANGTATDIAKRIFDAYSAGEYPECEVCAMMSWCYAGLSTAELADFAERTFARAGLGQRLRRELSPIFQFARARGLRVVVVSASPQPIVERAVALWNISPEDVSACRAATENGRILPRLEAPVPYAEHKPIALKELAPGAPMLAAFGDNVFDMDLLRAASLAVAVHPKPALRARLAELEGVWLFENEP